MQGVSSWAAYAIQPTTGLAASPYGDRRFWPLPNCRLTAGILQILAVPRRISALSVVKYTQSSPSATIVAIPSKGTVLVVISRSRPLSSISTDLHLSIQRLLRLECFAASWLRTLGECQAA